jgi:hypothetical protein
MKRLEVVTGMDDAELEESCFAVLDDHLFDVDGSARVVALQDTLKIVGLQQCHSQIDTLIQYAAHRAIQAYFPLRRLM